MKKSRPDKERKLVSIEPIKSLPRTFYNRIGWRGKGTQAHLMSANFVDRRDAVELAFEEKRTMGAGWHFGVVEWTITSFEEVQE